MVRFRYGPGWVRAIRSRISGTSAAVSTTASGSGSACSATSTSCTPGMLRTTSQPGCGSPPSPASITTVSGPTSSARSAQDRGSSGSASAWNGATSLW
ncbi:hypothetical protein [Actinoplanes ianthinogenes]|uniref:hypothetical protein n=1 Tax=Actinoplanes ianthinogenes TaxID=122358 RepID=UPI0027956E1C|nr:hypothetical protein [Actinoplanes ianthinogenes]